MKPSDKIPTGFIPPHGGYRKLLSFQKAEIIQDGTEYFCDRFFRPGHRTVDQMTQAARSGKQNIAEGSIASATSKQTEITLTNVARGSLEELELDYLDFLRKRKLKLGFTSHPHEHDSLPFVSLTKQLLWNRIRCLKDCGMSML